MLRQQSLKPVLAGTAKSAASTGDKGKGHEAGTGAGTGGARASTQPAADGADRRYALV